MKKEFWEDVKGYEGIYKVSNLGRIKSLERIDAGNHKRYEKIMKCSSDKQGYKILGLSKNGKTKTYKVHRIVAEIFIENNNNLKEVNHKDEVKSNNCVNNLEWCTRHYNVNYGTSIERGAKTQGKKVYQYCANGNFIKEYYSGMQVERETGFNQAYVNHCCNGKYEKAYGYIWSYEKLADKK